MPKRQIWEVIGGTDKGGIMVRAGRDLTSTQHPLKLATGARVEQVERIGDRLHYRLLEGQGPSEGWVSVKLKEKVLLAEWKEPAAAAPAAVAAVPRPAQEQQQEASSRAAPSSETGGPTDFAQRLEALREKYPGFTDPLPNDAWQWRAEEVENYFESGGFIKPKMAAKRTQQAKHEPPKVLPQRERSEAVPEGPQLSVAQALKLQEQLKDGFKGTDFQERLLVLQRKHPHRKQRGHADGTSFFEAFETLVVTVYARVLPKYGLAADWDGVRDMYARIASALKSPKVKRQQEELNILLGLPRDAVLKPSKKEEEAFVYRHQGDGNVPSYALPVLLDEDGDEAHEFMVEDSATGEIKTSLVADGCRPLAGRRRL